MAKRFLRIGLSLMVLAVLTLATLPVDEAQATAMNPPDVPAQVLAAVAYPSCLSSGDLGILVEYSIAYDTLPSTIVTNAYLILFVAADGSTQLTSVAPYTYVSNGYTQISGNPAGVAWLYFTPAQVTAYGLTSASMTSYGIWIIGSPAISWSGTVPKTIGGLSNWITSGSAPTQLGLAVLDYAGSLGILWSLSLSTTSPTGNTLTSYGEAYFLSAIPNLRTMAPQIFSAGTVTPSALTLDYNSQFGAVLTNGTGTATGSPITLASGSNTVNITGAGTFLITLLESTSGNVTSGTATVSNSPVAIVSGTNNITVSGTGDIVVSVALSDTQTEISSGLLGTTLDLTKAAAVFGMSVSLFSGLVWFIVTIIICAAVYGSVHDPSSYEDKSGKITMLIFDICIIGGAVIGLLPLLVAVLLFIGFGVLIGYVLFFRTSGA